MPKPQITNDVYDIQKYIVEAIVIFCIVFHKSKSMINALCACFLFITLSYSLDQQKSIMGNTIRGYVGFSFVQFLTNFKFQ